MPPLLGAPDWAFAKTHENITHAIVVETTGPLPQALILVIPFPPLNELHLRKSLLHGCGLACLVGLRNFAMSMRPAAAAFAETLFIVARQSAKVAADFLS
jgi:hypothetical protein